MKPNLILHIGSPKTGTSSIQSALINNKELLSKNGYHYLECLQWHDGAHHELGFAIRDKVYGEKKFSMEDSIKKIKNEIQSIESKTVIISSEILFYDVRENENNIKKLVNLFKDITLVVYLREPFDYLESLYKQMVKDPFDQCKQEPSDFIKSHLKHINYDEVISSYQGITKKTIIENYNKDENINAAFFKNVLRIDDTNMIINPKEKTNISLDGPALKLKFHYNKKNLKMAENRNILEKIIIFSKEQKLTNLKSNIFKKDDILIINKHYLDNNHLYSVPEIKQDIDEFSFHPVSEHMIKKFESFLMGN